MQKSLSASEIACHNANFQQGCELQKGLILLDGQPVRRLGFFARRKLQKSIVLFQKVLELNTANWQAMLLNGKSYQALDQQQQALDWFLRAHKESPSNGIIAKEAGLQAGRLQQHMVAIEIMEPASLANPNDAALHINLGLSFLLSAQPQAACFAFERACELEPDRSANEKLRRLAERVRSGEIAQPASEAEVVKLL